jgi:hypothetical protein
MFIVKRQKNTSHFFHLQDIFGDVEAKLKSPISACVFVSTGDNEALMRKCVHLALRESAL